MWIFEELKKKNFITFEGLKNLPISFIEESNSYIRNKNIKFVHCIRDINLTKNQIISKKSQFQNCKNLEKTHNGSHANGEGNGEQVLHVCWRLTSWQSHFVCRKILVLTGTLQVCAPFYTALWHSRVCAFRHKNMQCTPRNSLNLRQVLNSAIAIFPRTHRDMLVYFQWKTK